METPLVCWRKGIVLTLLDVVLFPSALSIIVYELIKRKACFKSIFGTLFLHL